MHVARFRCPVCGKEFTRAAFYLYYCTGTEDKPHDLAQLEPVVKPNPPPNR